MVKTDPAGLGSNPSAALTNCETTGWSSHLLVPQFPYMEQGKDLFLHKCQFMKNKNVRGLHFSLFKMKIANISLGKSFKGVQTLKYVCILMSLDNKCVIREKIKEERRFFYSLYHTIKSLMF